MAHDDTGEYERFVADREFAAAVRAAYRGRHDAADAVFWLSNPALPGPSGAASPAAVRRELERAAYARGAGPAAEAALIRLDEELRSDREATLAAIAEARRPVEAATSAGPVVIAPVPRRWWILAVAVIVALLIGGIVGARFAPIPRAAPTPSAVNAAGALALLEPKQTDEDMRHVNVKLTSHFLASSVRSIYHTSPAPGSVSRMFAYVAMDEQGEFCLLLISAEGAVASNCVLPSLFPATGLAVYAQDSGSYNLVRLLPNGQVEGEYGRNN